MSGYDRTGRRMACNCPGSPFGPVLHYVRGPVGPEWHDPLMRPGGGSWCCDDCRFFRLDPAQAAAWHVRLVAERGRQVDHYADRLSRWIKRNRRATVLMLVMTVLNLAGGMGWI